MMQRLAPISVAILFLPVVAGSQSVPVGCPADPDRVALAMTVVDSTGAPMAGVRVEIKRAIDSTGATRTVTLAGAGVARAMTDSTGSLCATVPAPGRYVMRPVRWRINRDLYEQEVVVDVTPTGATPRLLTYDPFGMTLADQARRRAMLDSLQVQRARWRERRPDTYRLRIEPECFCFGALAAKPTFVISGDRVVEIRRVEHAITDTAGFLQFHSAHTIDQLFDLAAAQIASKHRP